MEHLSTDYRVTWTIDVYADSPRRAAEKAREIQMKKNTLATVFEVNKKRSNKTETVDLLQ